MDIDEMFDAFWKAYPRKLDKIKARKAFKKLNPSEKLFNTILGTLEKQKKIIIIEKKKIDNICRIQQHI